MGEGFLPSWSLQYTRSARNLPDLALLVSENSIYPLGSPGASQTLAYKGDCGNCPIPSVLYFDRVVPSNAKLVN